MIFSQLFSRTFLLLVIGLLAACSQNSSPLQVGFLVDSPITGLHYTTETRQGFTQSDGSFQFRPGETVTFQIGATVLGSSRGQPLLTPFDLIEGAEALTDINEIEAALMDGDSPFNQVMNITRLLQSLDKDGDPANGIMIVSEAAALLGEAVIDFRQVTSVFTHDRSVTNLMESLNQAAAFDDAENRAVYSSTRTLQHLYGSLGLTIRDSESKLLSREVSREIDWDMDGQSDEAFHRRFDTAGNLIYEDRWWGASPGNYYTYQYDKAGHMRSLEHGDFSMGQPRMQTLIDFQYNARGNLDLVLKSGLSPEQVDYDYDEQGRLISIDRGFDTVAFEHNDATSLILISVDFNKDGTVDRIDTHEYDTRGLRTMVAEDHFADGTIEYIDRYQYNQRGQLVRWEVDQGADETLDSFVSLTYNDSGQQTERAYIYPASPSSDHSLSWVYESGLLIRDESRRAGVVTETVEYSYDAAGNVQCIRFFYGVQVDGAGCDEILSYGYDDKGRVIRKEIDGDGDGDIEDIEHYRYDSLDNIILTQSDWGADGEIDQEVRSTWEPHLRTDISAAIDYGDRADNNPLDELKKRLLYPVALPAEPRVNY